MENEIEVVRLDEVLDHPDNYREHPDDQLEHIEKSIDENGIYRNIVISSDNYILAGHGVAAGARRMGRSHIIAIRLPFTHDDPRALKVMAGDNEISNLGIVDDRKLTELLKTVHDADIDGLLGTGFDDMMLANLVYITRPASEIEDFDAAAHWLGLPSFEGGEKPLRVSVAFRNEADRQEFLEKLGLSATTKTKSLWYPPRETEDLRSIRFTDNGDAA